MMPGGCLRHRRSFRYLRISPLHRKFHHPLIYSSYIVCDALPRLSPGLSHHTHITAYAPFTPSNSDQRSHPLYYRGCWHRVCRCLFCWYSQTTSISPHSLLPSLKSFTTRGPSSLTRHRWIRVAPIVQDSPLLPPVGVWAVSQSQCDWSSSQTS